MNALPRTMKAVVKTEPGPGAVMQEVPVPDMGPDDALLRVRATSICGTDYHIYKWDKWAAGRIKTPQIMGHEFAAEVVAVGDRVTRVKPGNLVSAETHIVCGECLQCQAGQFHVCARTQIIGLDTNGCFAEYAVMPARNLWINPPDLAAELAAVQEPLGNAVHTALAVPLAGRTVLLTGCGPIGLMTIAVARQAGAAVVLATDVSPYRLELAARLGAVAVDPRTDDVPARVRELTHGAGADVLLEMSGHPSAINDGLASLRPGGDAALLGLPSEPFIVDWGNEIVMKGITLHGIAGRQIWRTWQQMQGLFTAGLDIGPVLTHTLPLADFAEGMELMRQGLCGKVVLVP